MSKKVIYFLILSIIVSLLISCTAIFGMPQKPLEINVRGDSFKISWKLDRSDNLNNDEDYSFFKVFYRTHGKIQWNLLNELPYSENPEFDISLAVLDYGVYDFAVSYVDRKGFESDLHSSLEASAEPVVGWYVNWASD